MRLFLLMTLVMSFFATAADGLAAVAKTSDLDLAQMRAVREMKFIEHRFRKEADARWNEMFNDVKPLGQSVNESSAFRGLRKAAADLPELNL